MRSLRRFVAHGLGAAALLGGCLFMECAGLAETYSGQTGTLPAGTRVTVRANRDVSALGEGDGRPLDFLVASDVRLAGSVVIAQGSVAHVRLLRRNYSSGPPLYTLHLMDVEIGKYRVSVTADDHIIPDQEPATSPYPRHTPGIIIPVNTPIDFTLTAPVPLEPPSEQYRYFNW